MRISKFKKPKIIFSILIAFFSLELYLGATLGYFTFKFFSKRVPSLIFDFGNYRLHLHHWLCGLAILIFALFFDFLPFPHFSLGFLGGAIFQGVYCYNDWYRIVIKKEAR